MILQALVRLYDMLATRGQVVRKGWSKAKVSHRIVIDTEGHLVSIVSARKKVIVSPKGAKKQKVKEIPDEMIVPKQFGRSNKIQPNFLCDSASYFFGITGKPERAIRCFEASKTWHHQILDNCDSVAAKAVLKYFDLWNPEIATQNSIILENMDEIEHSNNFVFSVVENDAIDDSAIQDVWERFYEKDEQSTDKPTGVCLVTGKEHQYIATIHPKLKPIKDAQPAGANLVSFNTPSGCSFGLVSDDRGKNAPVSEIAAYKYGEALNYLLADKTHKSIIGDTTVVYWSEHALSQYQDCWAFLSGNDVGVDGSVLNGVMEAVKNGKAAELNGVEINPNEPFYLLGLAPNGGRVSVRFFLQNTFGETVKNMMLHQERMAMANPPPKLVQIPLWMILKETVNPHSKNDASSPLLSGSLLRAIMLNTRYPVAVFQNIMMRIFADNDKDEGKNKIYKINYVRAAFIKAYLIRNSFYWKGRIQMTVNDNCTDIAYVLGRMFSVLESIQQSANPEINATIKDRYFNSACATPAGTFPVLLKLANVHLAKLEKKYPGRAVNLQKKLGKLMGMVTMPDAGRPIPNRLTLDEQGVFVLGYYQETQDRYTKKEEKAVSIVEESKEEI